MITNKLNIKKTNKANQIVVWGLFVLFCFNGVFSFIFFEIKLQSIRHEVKEKIIGQIPDNQLVEIIKPIGFDEHEFEHEGIMYDVVEKKEQNGKVILLCFADLNETELNHKLDKQIELNLDKNPVKNGKNQKIIDFVKTVYDEFQIPRFEFKNHFSHSKNPFIYLIFIKKITLSILSPPPQF